MGHDLLQIEMQKKDQSEKEKADSKNALEEYVYYIREKLSDTFAEFITNEARRDLVHYLLG